MFWLILLSILALATLMTYLTAPRGKNGRIDSEDIFNG